MKDYYLLLGIERNASSEQLQKALERYQGSDKDELSSLLIPYCRMLYDELLKKYEDFAQQIPLHMKAYQDAKSIIPPSRFRPIFIDEQQTSESQQNLAISYGYLLAIKTEKLLDDKIQLFEIPETLHDCHNYSGLGYDLYQPPRLWNLSVEGWIKLEDINDFNCRAGFQKMFIYKNHSVLQWPDGSCMSKHGSPICGATVVYRTNSPIHPLIVSTYGNVEEVWIKPYNGPIQAPYFRTQSTWISGPIGIDSIYLPREVISEKAGVDYMKYVASSNDTVQPNLSPQSRASSFYPY